MLYEKKNTSRWMWIGLASLPLGSALWGKDILGVSLGLSLLAYYTADQMIGRVGEMLAKAGRVGKDLNKIDKPLM